MAGILCHFLSYSLETESHTEPGARLVASMLWQSPLPPSTELKLWVHAAMLSFLHECSVLHTVWTLVNCTRYWLFHTLHLMLTVELSWFQPQLWAFNFSIVSSSFSSCSSSTQWGFSPSRWSSPSVILSLVFFDVKSVILLNIRRLAPTFPQTITVCVILHLVRPFSTCSR